nr:Imm1 family immunity protein [Actinomycetota bacterium]
GNTVDTSPLTEPSVSHRDAGAQLIYDWQQNEFSFPPDAEVPVTDVRAAVHEFARSGTRPAGIQWQEWEPPIEPGGTFLADDDPAWG